MYIFDQYKQLNLFCCNDKNNKLTPLQMDKENLTKLAQSEKNNPSCKIHYSTFHFKQLNKFSVLFELFRKFK